MKPIKNCFKLLTVLLLFILCLPSLAQTPAKERFRTVNNENEYYIEFIDTITKQVKKTFDLRKNNPYNNLPYSKKGESSNGYNEYQINNIKLKDVDLKVANLVKNMSFDDDYLIEKATGMSYDVALYNDYASKYILVVYDFLLVDETSLLGESSIIFLFSSDGDFIKKFNSFTRQCHNSCVTENGKYLAYTYGSMADESMNYFDKVGFQIIDVETGKVIVDNDFEAPVHSTVTTCFGNLIRISCMSLDYNTYIIYNFEKSKKYTKAYPTDGSAGRGRGVTDVGFVFEEPPRGSNIFRTDYYETDFKVEEIK